MNRGPNVALALAVLALGLLVALAFRHRPGEDTPPRAAGSSELVLRERIASPQARAAAPRTVLPPSGGIETPRTTLAGDSASVSDVHEPASLEPAPPPDLARSYPYPPPHHGAEGLAELLPRRGLWHVIEDGDTLESLAERYLGSAERAEELYEANRDRLLQPDVLPIGIELVIPRTGRESQPRRPGPIVPQGTWQHQP